jgi:hypothetical protein
MAGGAQRRASALTQTCPRQSARRRGDEFIALLGGAAAVTLWARSAARDAHGLLPQSQTVRDRRAIRHLSADRHRSGDR